MGRQTGQQRQEAWRGKAYDPSNWENWSQSKLRSVYGPERYQDNLEASANRRSLQGKNFLQNFLGTLATPFTFPLGAMGVPGVMGAGYVLNQDPNKTNPQPWIIDPTSGEVIQNPAVDEALNYVNAYNSRLHDYKTKNIYELAASQPVTATATGGTSMVQEIDPYLGMSTKISDNPIDTYEQFVERTRNSPAMRAGVFDPKDLYQTYISDQDFQVARDTGNLEDFARAYPLSQTAKKM